MTPEVLPSACPGVLATIVLAQPDTKHVIYFNPDSTALQHKLPISAKSSNYDPNSRRVQTFMYHQLQSTISGIVTRKKALFSLKFPIIATETKLRFSSLVFGLKKRRKKTLRDRTSDPDIANIPHPIQTHQRRNDRPTKVDPGNQHQAPKQDKTSKVSESSRPPIKVINLTPCETSLL
ncbi:predicted protein [Sclerotinia sclerotiorum 1980 UF-70]|uniref:Uncharacterized protein n=1 Tax=Sclerotinia sclerotiorum (strain ATCC 18683 / 1980 / Ss-1) TaxID=665079 RepID=A7EG68_SCLS1|nr:predicted protein [Sclerotinia sclerotiorum 1980 UF-70]EDO01834.1 predicted protein [Sclerotinia sclerotiorum 1980 UF-70]